MRSLAARIGVALVAFSNEFCPAAALDVSMMKLLLISLHRGLSTLRAIVSARAGPEIQNIWMYINSRRGTPYGTGTRRALH